MTHSTEGKPTGTPPLCFVIGPIGKNESEVRKRADLLLGLIIRETACHDEFGYRVVRADEIQSAGMIDSQVITLLLKADLVIADLSGQNANAFYELGIRHVFAKPTIHMIDTTTQIPFDVAPYRTIEYDLTDYSSIQDTRSQLRKFIKDIRTPNHKVDNPVTRSIGIQEVKRTASSNETAIFEILESLQMQLSRLQRDISHDRVDLPPDGGVNTPSPNFYLFDDDYTFIGFDLYRRDPATGQMKMIAKGLDITNADGTPNEPDGR